MRKLIILSLPLILISNVAAAETPSAYSAMRADIAKTVKELEDKANYLNANGNACSNNYEVNKQCPQVAGITPARQGFMAPLKSDIDAVKKFLNDKLTKVETELGKGIDQEQLKKVTACSDGGNVAIKSEEGKKAALDAGSTELQKLLENKSEKLSEKGLKLKLADLHRASPDFSQKVKACAGSMGSMFTLPNTPHELLVEVFKATMSSPGQCPANAVAAYHAVGDQNGLLAKLASQLEALNTQMKKDSATIGGVIAKTKPVTSTCDTQAQAPGDLPKEKESKVSGDGKPATTTAKNDKAAVTGQSTKAADSKPADAPAVAAAKPEVKSETVTPPRGESTPTDTTQKFLADTAPKVDEEKAAVAEQPKDLTVAQNSSEASDVTGLKPITKDDLDPKEAYKSNSDVELKPTQDAPAVQALDDAPLRGNVSGDRTVAQARNDYQNDPIFKNRDLDFNSTKDTRYIQNALNQVRQDQGLPALSTDGVMGSRTTLALDQVMQNPEQKAAFLTALKQQMSGNRKTASR